MNYGAQPGAELTSQRSQPVLATLLPNVCRALGDPRVAPSPLTRLCLPSVDAPVGGQCDEPLAQQGVGVSPVRLRCVQAAVLCVPARSPGARVSA